MRRETSPLFEPPYHWAFVTIACTLMALIKMQVKSYKISGEEGFNSTEGGGGLWNGFTKLVTFELGFERRVEG